MSRAHLCGKHAKSPELNTVASGYCRSNLVQDGVDEPFGLALVQTGSLSANALDKL